MKPSQSVSLIKGAWSEIVRLWDYVFDLEKRVEKLEQDIIRSDTKPIKGRISFHPRNSQSKSKDL